MTVSLMLPPARLLVFMLVSVLLLTRAHFVRSLDEPWLEDIELLLASLDSRVGLLTPIYDCPLLAQRIIARLVEPVVGLEYGPLLFGIISILFLAYVATYIMRPGFEWLIPGLPLRATLACGVGLGPGTIDIAGSLINTSYSLSLLVLLMSLERPMKGSGRLLGVSVLASLSCHTAFIAAPVLLLRTIREQRKWPFALSFICIVVGLLVGVLRNFSLSDSVPVAASAAYLQSGIHYLTSWLQSFFIAPFSGGFLAYSSHEVWPLNLLFVVIGMVIWLRLGRAVSSETRLYVGAITVGGLLFVGASVVGRAHYGNGAVDLAFGTLSRHNSIYFMTMVLAWAPLVPWRALCLSRIGRIALALPVALHLSGMILLCKVFSPSPTPTWPESIDALRTLAKSSSTDTREVLIVPYPLEGWASQVLCRSSVEQIRCLGTWNRKEHEFLIPPKALADR